VDILRAGILDPICRMITSKYPFERKFAIETLSKLAEYGRLKDSHAVVLLTFPLDSVRSDILKLKLFESPEKSLGSGDSDVRSWVDSLSGMAKLAKYGILSSVFTQLILTCGNR
jgi:hypothetical protein